MTLFKVGVALPKISIVLPVYNGERYLPGAIESIQAQSLDDWELIIVDDCSTDGTPDIVNSFASRDKRIKAFRNQVNKKLPASLNVGFSCASGRYLTWTSDDNLLEKDALRLLSDYLDAHEDCGLVYSNMKFIDEDGRLIRESSSLVTSPLLVYCYNVVGACFMYRSEIQTKLSGYDEDLFLVEDYDFWLRCFRSAKIHRICCSPYKYRVHGSSLSGTRELEIREKTCGILKREWQSGVAGLLKRALLAVGLIYNQTRFQRLSAAQSRYRRMGDAGE